MWNNSLHGLKENVSCNLKKCKELNYLQKYWRQYITLYLTFLDAVVLFYWGLRSKCKFRAHVNLKLIKANKCLRVLRTLRKEQYSPAEIDHLFTFLVLPNFIYGLPVYGASEPDLNVIQKFLDVVSAVLFLTPFWLRIY